MIRKENEIMKKFDSIFEQAREIIRQQIAAARLRLICARRGYQLNA